MAPFLFRCPNTGLHVQGWSAEEVPADELNTYETVTCIACQQVHLGASGMMDVFRKMWPFARHAVHRRYAPAIKFATLIRPEQASWRYDAAQRRTLENG